MVCKNASSIARIDLKCVNAKTKVKDNMFRQINMIPSVEEIRQWLPLPANLAKVKTEFDMQIRENMRTRKRFVVVCGPCSADDVKAVAEYVRFLKGQADLYPELLVVARIYTVKPHSDGTGYPGMLFGGADGKDIVAGIVRCRKVMTDCLAAGLPIADELLFPELWDYFSDLVSYPFVGARSSEDTLHRAYASGLSVPVGIKNGTDGSVFKLASSVAAASRPSVFPVGGKVLQTDGNKMCHAVLRGGQDDGRFRENFSERLVRRLKFLLNKQGLNDFIMVDLSHANSGKIAANQLQNACRAVSNRDVCGVMAESYLYDGANPDGEYGVSRTDDCLGMDKTADLLKLIRDVYVSRAKSDN